MEIASYEKNADSTFKVLKIKIPKYNEKMEVIGEMVKELAGGSNNRWYRAEIPMYQSVNNTPFFLVEDGKKYIFIPDKNQNGNPLTNDEIKQLIWVAETGKKTSEMPSSYCPIAEPNILSCTPGFDISKLFNLNSQSGIVAIGGLVVIIILLMVAFFACIKGNQSQRYPYYPPRV